MDLELDVSKLFTFKSSFMIFILSTDQTNLNKGDINNMSLAIHMISARLVCKKCLTSRFLADRNRQTEEQRETDGPSVTGQHCKVSSTFD